MRHPEIRKKSPFDTAFRLLATALLAVVASLPEKAQPFSQPIATDMPGSGRSMDVPNQRAIDEQEIDWQIRELKIKEGEELIRRIIGDKEIIPSTVAIVDSGWCPEAWPEELRSATITNTILLNQPPENCYEHGVGVTALLTGARAENNIGIEPVCLAEFCNFVVVNAASGAIYNGPNGSYVFNYSDLGKAISWNATLTDTNGSQIVDVINMSFGGSSDATSLRKAIQLAIANGILLVAGTGNDGVDDCLFPARYEGVLAVGAIGHLNGDPSTWGDDLFVTNFSNWCGNLLFAAPGLNIVTVDFDEEELAQLSLTAGTSIATPLVSGMLGALVSFLRTMGRPQQEARISARAALIESASVPTYVDEDQKIRWGSAGLPDLLLAVNILQQKYKFEPTPTPFPTTPPEEPPDTPTVTPVPQPTNTPTPQPTSQPIPKEWRLLLPLIANGTN